MKADSICENGNLVKRTVLKLVVKIFDPLGLLNAFTVKLKIFQSLCKHKTAWDEELRGEMRVLYDSLMTELSHPNGVSAPVFLSKSDTHAFQMQAEKLMPP